MMETEDVQDEPFDVVEEDSKEETTTEPEEGVFALFWERIPCKKPDHGVPATKVDDSIVDEAGEEETTQLNCEVDEEEILILDDIRNLLETWRKLVTHKSTNANA